VAQGATGGSSGIGSGPSGGGAYWFINFQMNVKDSAMEGAKDTLTIPPVNYNLPPVTVAVMDTGVDSMFLRRNGYLFDGNSMPGSCIGKDAASGWNFCSWNSAIHDDYPGIGHGSNVSRLIVEQSIKFKKTPVKILPVKIIPRDGAAKLYDMLCGFVYAKERGAKIINASLGYYSCDTKDFIDSGSIIFKEYIKEYLTKENILLVAAGGNKDDDQQIKACARISRNLDEINFYPASFSKDTSMHNIIAVTTTRKFGSPAGISPRQNFSNSVIDVGVHADDESQPQICSFINPRLQNSKIEGSSFAAPIITGIIASQFGALSGALPNTGNKNAILDFLTSSGVILNNVNYAPKIRNGIVARH
jgi:subtilisin family serine protease